MVALRKESVDRNFDTVQIVIIVMVALRKESVDRNVVVARCKAQNLRSLSARRAWIEIAAEQTAREQADTSLSARRAWIEIQVGRVS